MSKDAKPKSYISARVSEYSIPPIKDMLVLGKNAPIGFIAVRRALDLLSKTPFEQIEIDNDDVISGILIRTPLLRRITQQDLSSFVLTHIKPLLGPDEVLQVEVDIEVFISDSP